MLSLVLVLTARALAYADGMIEISGTPPHDLTTAREIEVMGSGSLTAAYILMPAPVDAFSLYSLQAGDVCTLGGLSCTYNRALSDLAQRIGVACDSRGPGEAMATLRVEGANSLVDFDEETIFCFPDPGIDDAFAVTPITVNVGDVPVGTPSTGAVVTVKNLLDVSYAISIGGFTNEWAFTGCANPCIIGPLEEKPLVFTLTPQGLGPRNSLAMLSGGTGGLMSNFSVALQGNGVDRESLDVIVPAGPIFNLDMGPVPLSGGTRTLRLRYTGPSLTQMATISSTDTSRVSVSDDAFTTPPGGTDIVVTCRSPIPDEVSETLTITSSPLIAQNTMTVNVLCSVTSASVTLDPTELDFGDVLLGEDPVELTVMVRNTGAAAVRLDGFQIVSDPARMTLQLVSMPVGDLAPNAVAMVTVRLTPTMPEDYADTVKLRFTVDGIALDVPIKGRVTVKSGRIDPTGALDLGTACVGRPISGMIRLTNDGTAPIVMMAPAITGPFTSMYDPDVTFPVEIPEGQVQSVTITTSETSGTLTGTFDWVGEVGPYALDLRAEYIADGTAVSPRSLDFAVIDVDATTAPRTITLENCNSVPATLAIQSVVSRLGPARAWLVEPGQETTTLDPGERYTVTVRFAPTTPGQHLAELPIIVDGEQTTVMLSGFADGELFERTSFYACTCNGGSLAAGWPLLLALLPLRRRRIRAVRGRSATSR